MAGGQKIIDGLNDAVAFLRGDMTRGRVVRASGEGFFEVSGTAAETVVWPRWRPIKEAPKDRMLLLSCVGWPPAAKRGGGWQAVWPVKVGGFWDRSWHVFGASWEPTHFMPLPPPPQDT